MQKQKLDWEDWGTSELREDEPLWAWDWGAVVLLVVMVAVALGALSALNYV